MKEAKPIDRVRALLQTAPKRAVSIGLVVGAIAGLLIGWGVLTIVGCRREEAHQLEQRRLEAEFQKEMDAKKADELRAAQQWQKLMEQQGR